MTLHAKSPWLRRLTRRNAVLFRVVNLSENVYINLLNADRLTKDWNAPIYAFFHPVPSIDYVGNPARRVHVFECNARTCKGKGMTRRHVRRYLDTSDGKSTSNLRRHAKLCWGEEAVTSADAVRTHGAARQVVERSLKTRDGSITAMFKRIKGGESNVTYSHRQHTKTEVRYAPQVIHLPLCTLIKSSARSTFDGQLKNCAPSK